MDMVQIVSIILFSTVYGSHLVPYKYTLLEFLLFVYLRLEYVAYGSTDRRLDGHLITTAVAEGTPAASRTTLKVPVNPHNLLAVT